ncbi:uncharacterized protein A1O9_07147 [Exophiala aquamarina CBS 119918]|uniref:Alcohol dehydrogenase n=1 Tax=Exophiala aquamarina CBS 119918 TaxID=1182545 RepID=A0A072PB14_9EURO|nr:uncharacterized protein A1O9_07147 [Exophiala aquamarina CBS 119918]KEF56957.1 hypothetical protein A1O9_07147 [Exophiala aquamarina CBS 119918]
MGLLHDLLTQFNPVPHPTYDFSGKTIIVTGANTGIGKEAVKHFLRLNASRVVGTARTLSKCEETLAAVESATPDKGRIEIWELEYGSYASVLSFCSRVAKLDRVDNIILNAGVATRDYEVLERHERHITVNVISTTLLAALLLPVLQRSAERFKINPMLTITGSKIYAWSKFPEREASNMIEALNSSRDMSERYQVTKLLQLFAVLEIAERVSQRYPAIIVNTVSPGFVQTDLMRDAKGFEKFTLMAVLKVLAWTSEQGGRTLVESAVRESDSHGVMLSEGRLKLPHVEPWILAEKGCKIQKQLWVELSVIIEAIQPGALTTL